MGFFSNWVTPAARSYVLIDVGSRSVGFGLVSYTKGKRPALRYTLRKPIERRGNEQPTSAMVRTVAAMLAEATSRSSGVLRAATGSGRPDAVLVSVASPWQTSTVRIERVEEKKPFTFTRSRMEQVIKETATVDFSEAGASENAMAVVINGYHTGKPFGKKATRADIFVLSSVLDREATDGIATAIRAAYHDIPHEFTAFSPLAYAVLRDVYPHEHNFLMLDVSGETTDIALIKQGLLVSVMSTPIGANHFIPGSSGKTDASAAARKEWIQNVSASLKMFSEDNALPRALFLLADGDITEPVRKALDDESLRSLWLSDEPLCILPVAHQHFAPLLTLGASAEPDIFIDLLALFHEKHLGVL